MQKAIGRKASNQIEQIAPPLGKRAAEGQLYSICIVGNVEQRRTEAEISNGEGVVLAVVYETSDGWHTDIVVEHFGEAASDLQTALDHAKENLSHYVNRRGKTRRKMPPKLSTHFGSWRKMTTRRSALI